MVLVYISVKMLMVLLYVMSAVVDAGDGDVVGGGVPGVAFVVVVDVVSADANVHVDGYVVGISVDDACVVVVGWLY